MRGTPPQMHILYLTCVSPVLLQWGPELLYRWPRTSKYSKSHTLHRKPPLSSISSLFVVVQLICWRLFCQVRVVLCFCSVFPCFFLFSVLFSYLISTESGVVGNKKRTCQSPSINFYCSLIQSREHFKCWASQCLVKKTYVRSLCMFTATPIWLFLRGGGHYTMELWDM